jgi:hypothetical protein
VADTWQRRNRTFQFHKRQRFLTSWATVRLSKWTLFHRISYTRCYLLSKAHKTRTLPVVLFRCELCLILMEELATENVWKQNVHEKHEVERG